ncbi:MAG: sensor histidine kinase KdpD [Hyphomicrobium sp.]|jgi:two-component system sensor histidine kinase KdpD
MPPEPSQRASPDALLALTEKERHGRLKIFLGAAPGVGKTYAMLSAARAAAGEGREVVLGLVETHGRRETEALVEGFEVIPRKPVVYVNRILSEFDLDKALARRPSLILIDELAHANIPGSRHLKRWQDVEELLAAGIDVWTTMNVQHLEGLNDIVQRITRVQVRETVPDRVFEEADDIVLIDLPTEELLKRLAEGKVYVEDMAARARKRFFKPENLTALRELTLRRAAERIDTDLVERMQAQAIEGPWAAGERILACIGPDRDAATIVRAAKRLADVMDAPWIAATVQQPGDELNERQRSHRDKALTFAQSLGAETSTLAASDVASEILRFARLENVTQIVLGRSRGGYLTELLRRSLPHELLRRADGIAVHVLTSRATGDVEPLFRLPPRPRPGLLPLLVSTLAVGVAAGMGHFLNAMTTLPNLSMVFLMAVVFAAVTFGIWPAIYASVLSFLAYNFLFIDPLYTFTVATPDELLALVVFLAMAVITATLAGRVREQARIAVARMRASRRLYDFTRKLSGVAAFEAIPGVAAHEINAGLERPVVLLIEQAGELELSASSPPIDTLDTAATTAARWAHQHGEPAGAGTATLPAIPWFFLPLKTTRGPLGIIGIGQTEPMARLDPEARATLETLVEQTATALDRAALAREMVSARSAAETERVRNTLLASISHDFRTPLASILGSATGLLDYGDKLDAKARKDLLGQIKAEAEELDDMVRNLLAMTRIDAGALEVNRDWADLRELAERAANAARRRGAAQHIDVLLPDKLPLVRADARLIEQAISNVIANAIAHTPAETRIVIDGEAARQAVILRVTDDGPGISKDMLPHIFEKFVRSSDPGLGDGGEGTGLGLAIAKGITDAHGATIAAESPIAKGRGTRLIFSFPLERSAK